MMNKKSLKSTLLMSGVSILLSGAMLVGTTFAWFHDTAESAENTITAGTLDVDLEYNSENNTGAEDANWKSAKDISIFKEADTKKWEPGKMVFSYPIRIVNKGTKALKYKITVKTVEDSNSLSKVILSTVIAYPTGGLNSITDRDSEWTKYTAPDADKSEGTLEKTLNSDALAVVLYWQPTENDDTYNFEDGAEHSFKFTVDVYATQTSSESDSVGNKYDETLGGDFPAAEKTKESWIVKEAVETGITDVNDVSEALKDVPSIDIKGKMTSGIGQGIIGSALPPAAPEGTVTVTPLTYDRETEKYQADVSFKEANPQMTVSGICGVVGLLHNAVVAQKDNIQSINIGGTEVDTEIIKGLRALNDNSKTDPVGFSASVLDGVLNGFMAAFGGGTDSTGGPAWLLVPLTVWATPIMDPESEPGSMSGNVLTSIIQGDIDELDGHACDIVITDTQGNAVTYSLKFEVTKA